MRYISNSNARRWTLVSVMALPLAMSAVAWAQPKDAPSPESTPPAKSPAPKKKPDPKKAEEDAARLLAESESALNKGDLPGAESATRSLIELQPDNFVHAYNLGCILARRGNAKDAGEWIAKAVELGYTDLRHLQRDPDLKGIRDDPNYKALLSDWDGLLSKSADRNLAQVREFFKGKAYRSERDERLRMIFLGAIEPRAFDESRAEMSQLADWANESVFPGLYDAEQLKRDAWVIVVLPTRQDFGRWSFKTFGSNANNGLSMIGGSYQHDNKRLVSQDLGGSLRHEFFHALHWRDCTRRGQVHAMWVQEGLCSLVEDYDILPGGKLNPAPSWRTNAAARMLSAANFVPLAKLVTSSPQDFFGGRRLGYYAESRALFLYLWQQGKLRAWYESYTTNFRDDRTGKSAIEGVLGKPLDAVEKDFRQWLRDLPVVPEELKPGMASLGVEVENGEGEGPKVVGTPRGSLFANNDVITSVNKRPTRDLPELLRVLGTYRPHDVVPVTVRRGKVYKDLEITLSAMR